MTLHPPADRQAAVKQPSNIAASLITRKVVGDVLFVDQDTADEDDCRQIKR